MDDWQLVAHAQRGDLRAFAELVRRYQEPVIHFCERMAGNREDAEDLAQECFVRLHRTLPRLTPRARFTTVLFGIARNLTLNYLRDSKRRGRGEHQPLEAHRLADPAGPSPARVARLREMEALIERGLAALSAQHREVLILREMEGLDYAEIARIVRCRKGTVKSRIARAREQLRIELLEHGGELL